MTASLTADQTHFQGWPGLIEAFRPYLLVSEITPVTTLQEGNTPLIPVPAIANRAIGHGKGKGITLIGGSQKGKFRFGFIFG